MRQDDDTPEPFEEGETRQDAIPSAVMEGEDLTPIRPIQELPGFEVGWTLCRRRTQADAVEALRLTLIEGGTDPGTAALVAQKFGRRIGLRYA